MHLLIIKIKTIMNQIQKIAIAQKLDLNDYTQPNYKPGLFSPQCLDLADKVVNTLDTNKGSTSQYYVKIERYNSVFGLEASISGTSISLSPLYFISRDQVPFTGPDDPNLEDDLLLQQFADNIAKEFHDKTTSTKISWKDRMSLRMYLETVKNSDKAKQALTFILLHEIGHAENHHQKRKLAYVNKLSQFKYTLINILTLGIFKRAALDLQSRKHEAEADAFGFPEAEGGIYLFKSARKFHPRGCMEHIAYALLCFSCLFSHGTFGAREDRIKTHLKLLN